MGADGNGTRVFVQAPIDMMAKDQHRTLGQPGTEGSSLPDYKDPSLKHLGDDTKQQVSNVFRPVRSTTGRTTAVDPEFPVWLLAEREINNRRTLKLTVKAHIQAQVRPGRLMMDDEKSRGWFADRLETTINLRLGNPRNRTYVPKFRTTLIDSAPEPSQGFTDISFSREVGVGLSGGTWDAVSAESKETTGRSSSVKDFRLRNTSEGSQVQIVHELAWPDSRGKPYDIDRPGFSLWPKTMRDWNEGDVGAFLGDALDVFAADHRFWTGGQQLQEIPESCKSAQSVEAQGLWEVENPMTSWIRTGVLHVLVTQRTRFVYAHYDNEWAWCRSLSNTSHFRGRLVMAPVLAALDDAASVRSPAGHDPEPPSD